VADSYSSYPSLPGKPLFIALCLIMGAAEHSDINHNIDF
jgi:hypothetical protein